MTQLNAVRSGGVTEGEIESTSARPAQEEVVAEAIPLAEIVPASEQPSLVCPLTLARAERSSNWVAARLAPAGVAAARGEAVDADEWGP
jgi:hypothetical protein